jgi:hypothetical protein
VIRFLERIAFSVERNLKNVVVGFRMYSVIFAFCFFIFLLRGISPLTGILREKLAISKQLTASYAVMQKNLENAQQASKDINDNKDQLVLLDRYMPIETNVQTYMLDFIDAVGADGFTLKNFTQDASSGNIGQVDLTIALEGLGYPTELVKNVEMLKRVTQVKRVTVYQNSKGITSINLVITIYTLPI